jgi:hypothetical protein
MLRRAPNYYRTHQSNVRVKNKRRAWPSHPSSHTHKSASCEKAQASGSRRTQHLAALGDNYRSRTHKSHSGHFHLSLIPIELTRSTQPTHNVLRYGEAASRLLREYTWMIWITFSLLMRTVSCSWEHFAPIASGISERILIGE